MRQALLAAGLSFAACLSAQAQSAQSPVKDVRIGVLTDMTSVFSSLVGPGSVQAAQMAIDDFVAEEKPAFKVSLISADHTSKADVASGIARRWFDQENVDVIADVAGAAVTLAVSKLGAQKNKLILATASGQNSLSGVDCQATTLHWTYNTWAVAGTTARAITKEGGNSWFFLTADYAGGRSLEEDATKALTAVGGKVLGGVRHPFGAADYSSALLSAESSGAKVIAFANAGADIVNSIKQANEFNLTKKHTIAGLLMFIADVHALGLELAQGMEVTAPFYWDLNEGARAWSKRFHDTRKVMPTFAQAGLYSAVRHYLKAVKAAGTTQTETVIAKMRETRVNDMFAQNAYLRADNLLIHDVHFFKVKTPAESKYAWDYYKPLKTVSGEEAFAPLSESTCPLVAKK